MSKGAVRLDGAGPCASFRSNRRALADIWGDIRKVAGALDIEAQGEALVSDLRKRMRKVSEDAGTQAAARVACIEWVDPLMAAGNWVPELVEMAGGENLFGEAGKHAPWMTWEELAEADPDVIVALPCGYDIARTLQDMPILEAKPGWSDLRAVREGRVAVADGNQYFNRPGPRVAESLEIMAEILPSGALDYGHAGKGWVRYHGKRGMIGGNCGIPWRRGTWNRGSQCGRDWRGAAGRAISRTVPLSADWLVALDGRRPACGC